MILVNTRNKTLGQLLNVVIDSGYIILQKLPKVFWRSFIKIFPDLFLLKLKFSSFSDYIVRRVFLHPPGTNVRSRTRRVRFKNKNKPY